MTTSRNGCLAEEVERAIRTLRTTHGARVRSGMTGRRPDVTIVTDAQTWLELREGKISGIEAFSQRRLYARGDVNLAVGFEGRFRLEGGRPLAAAEPRRSRGASWTSWASAARTSSPTRWAGASRSRRGPGPRASLGAAA